MSDHILNRPLHAEMGHHTSTVQPFMFYCQLPRKRADPSYQPGNASSQQKVPPFFLSPVRGAHSQKMDAGNWEELLYVEELGSKTKSA